jgi:hypothetical protein
MSEMMPAGKYWIGDLCYVLGDFWDEFCGIVFPKTGAYQGKCIEGRLTLGNGVEFAAFHTLYCDGLYEDQRGRFYGIVTGAIGCVKLDDIPLSTRKSARGLGRVITFSEPFEVSHEGRVLRFGGKVRIDTVESWWEDEE